MKIKVVALTLLVLLMAPTLHAAQISMGSAMHSDPNLALIQANQVARTQAIFQELGLGADISAQNWAKVSANILANPASFINFSKNLLVHHADNQAWVLMEVDINRPALDKALNELNLGDQMPSTVAPGETTPKALILCLVSEEVAPGRPPVYWWSGASGLPACPARVARALAALNYAPFDTAPWRGELGPAITRNLVLSQEQALELGQKAGVELVLWGRVRSYPILAASEPNPSPLVQLALLSVKEKRMLAQVETEGAVYSGTLQPGLEEEINSQVQDAMNKLFELAGKLVAPAPPARVRVEVEGISSMADVARLETLFARLDGAITQVQRESMSAGRVTLVLDTTVDGLELAQRLEAAETDGWKVRVMEKTATSLKLSPLSE